MLVGTLLSEGADEGNDCTCDEDGAVVHEGRADHQGDPDDQEAVMQVEPGISVGVGCVCHFLSSFLME